MRSRWQAPRGPREVAAPQSARGAAAAGSWLMRGAVIAGMAGWAPVGKAATGASVALPYLHSCLDGVDGAACTMQEEEPLLS